MLHVKEVEGGLVVLWWFGFFSSVNYDTHSFFKTFPGVL